MRRINPAMIIGAPDFLDFFLKQLPIINLPAQLLLVVRILQTYQIIISVFIF